jgi:TonB family protein
MEFAVGLSSLGSASGPGKGQPSFMLEEKFACAADFSPLPVAAVFPPQPSAIEPTGTFSRAIMVEAPGYVARRSVNCAISFVVHFGTILILLAAPLFFSGEPRWMAFNAPELVTVPLPPPKDPPGFRPHTVYGRENRLFSSVKLLAPVFNSDRFLHAPAVSPPDEPLKPSPLGASGGIGEVLDGIVSKAYSPLVAPVFPAEAHAVQIGGDLKPSRLVSGLSLAYPQIAEMAHVFGTVVIEAVIDETGKVTDVRAVSGNLLLASAAIRAVSHEKFQPMMLNGMPTRCDLMVEVSFRLRSSLF